MEIKIRIFHFACLIFLSYSIIVLNIEKYEVNYKLGNHTNIKFQYLECVHLTDLFENQSIIDLNEINYENFNKSIGRRYVYDFDYSAPDALKIILNKIKSNNYLIIRKRICLIKDDEKEFNFAHFFKQLTYFIFNNKTFMFWEYEKYDIKFELRTVLKLEYPYSDCRLTNYKFKCLNDCSKRKYKLSNYYYNSYETGIIYLNYKLNNSILDNQKLCSKQCKYHYDCEITNINKKESRSMTKLIVAYQSIGSFNYYIQLIGLISLFLNISFNQFFIKLFLICNLGIRLFKNFKWIKLSIFAASLILMSISYLITIDTYLDKRDNPVRKEIYIKSYQFNELNIAICVKFDDILNEYHDYFFYKNDNRTLSQMEKLTELNESSIEIYSKYQNKKLNLKWRLEPKVIFYEHQRCYPIIIQSMKLKIKTKLILSSFKLIININYKNFKLYILSENKLLQLNSYKYNELFNFIEYTFIRSKINRNDKCINYKNSNLNCLTQNECINICKINNLYSKLKKIDGKLVIYKDYLTQKQWNNLTINDYSYYSLLDDCVEKHSFKDCDISYFDDHNQIKYLNYRSDQKEIELNLYYDKIYIVTDEPSLFKLLLDLLNIQIIIFGLNAFKLISLALKFLNLNLKFLINLLCLIGISYHLWFIFNQIINDDLIYNQYYELSDKFKMPNLFICYKWIEVDKNELEIDNLFDGIKYLNKLNEWKLIDKELNYSDSLFKIDKLKLNDYNCFRLELDLEYDIEQFEFTSFKTNLKIYFNMSIRSLQIINLITKLDDDLSEPSYMNYGNSIFILTSELSELIYNDKFKFFKNPLSIFNDNQNLDDIDRYLNNIISNFDKKLANIGKEENWELFENFTYESNQFQKKLNQKLIFLINHLDKRANKNSYGAIFKYNLNFFKRNILITNDDNFIKLIINLLNLMSFWTHIGLLDLHYYLFKINLACCLVKFYNFFLSKFVSKI